MLTRLGSFETRSLLPYPHLIPRCARCGTPVDGPSCRGCAFLQKKFDEGNLHKDCPNVVMSAQLASDREIKEIINDLGYKRFRGEEIDEEYERDCEIRIRKLKQDFNIWGSEVRKKEKAYEEEKYAAACRYMLSVTCDDEDDYIPLAITPDLPIEEPNNSLIMGDEHLDTILRQRE
ncbi:hypothetical protein Tco_0428773 [Tanacetum coccineum]